MFFMSTFFNTDCIWAGTYEINLNKCHKVQIDAMQIVSGAAVHSNVNIFYEELCWLNVNRAKNMFASFIYVL